MIKGIWRSRPTLEGAGVRLQRVFGYEELPKLDPFLLLDDFSSQNPQDYLPGFPWHPHRGIETVTYILNGKVAHEDSIGNKGTIGQGQIQWMTAGSGIIHQEMPQKSPELTGFQLWVNMPAKHKMSSPRYQDFGKSEIPQTELGNIKVKTIAGKLREAQGPVEDLMARPQFLDVEIPNGEMFHHKTEEGHKLFAYTISGSGNFEGHISKGRELILYAGNEAKIIAKENLRLLLISGKPLGEPVAWHGPIVMNTQAELQKAFQDLKNGSFARKPKL